MTNKWRATMPKERPDDETVHIVVGAKDSNGNRVEFCGQVPADRADEVLKAARDIFGSGGRNGS